MDNNGIIEALKKEFGGAVLETGEFRGELTVYISKDKIKDVLSFLRDDPVMAYNFLSDLTAVDYKPENRKPRFEVVYNIYSISENRRIRVKVRIEEEDPVIQSVTSLWSGANWLEREAWDMFGIKFEGHPNLKRLLMYEEFEGHPLRKDYPHNKRQPLVGPKN